MSQVVRSEQIFSVHPGREVASSTLDCSYPASIRIGLHTDQSAATAQTSLRSVVCESARQSHIRVPHRTRFFAGLHPSSLWHCLESQSSWQTKRNGLIFERSCSCSRRLARPGISVCASSTTVGTVPSKLRFIACGDSFLRLCISIMLRVLGPMKHID